MKRSQMVELIANKLYYRDLANQDQFWYSLKDRPLLDEVENKEIYYSDAALILYEIEEVGMYPPDRFMNEGDCYVSEWEPE